MVNACVCVFCTFISCFLPKRSISFWSFQQFEAISEPGSSTSLVLISIDFVKRLESFSFRSEFSWLDILWIETSLSSGVLSVGRREDRRPMQPVVIRVPAGFFDASKFEGKRWWYVYIALCENRSWDDIHRWFREVSWQSRGLVVIWNFPFNLADTGTLAQLWIWRALGVKPLRDNWRAHVKPEKLSRRQQPLATGTCSGKKDERYHQIFEALWIHTYLYQHPAQSRRARHDRDYLPGPSDADGLNPYIYECLTITEITSR